MPTSFLAPLPGNCSTLVWNLFSCTPFRPSTWSSTPSYPVVPSREYLERPPSCHPPLSDGYEISPSLVNHGSRKVLLYGQGQESLLKFNHTWFEPKHLTVKLSPFSLTGEVKIWYDQTAGRVGGDWIKLNDEILLPCYQSACSWNSVGKIFANGKIWDTSSYSGRC